MAAWLFRLVGKQTELEHLDTKRAELELDYLGLTRAWPLLNEPGLNTSKLGSACLQRKNTFLTSCACLLLELFLLICVLMFLQWWIHLVPTLNCAANACRDVIERLITLGFYYRELDRFATKSRNLSWIRTVSKSPLSQTCEVITGKKENQSVYRRAIANGIVEVLSVYRSAVLQIEQKLLSDSVPILATVTQGLNKVGCEPYILFALE